MELTVENIFISLLLLGLSFMTYLYIRERKKNEELDSHLAEFSMEKNDDLFGKGKYSELGLMSAGIAHEISNPLSIISGRIEQIQRMYRDPGKQKEMAKGIQQIQYSTERISQIIQSLREYIYRDDNSSEDFISFTEILEDVLIFCGQRLKNHGIELRLINTENIFIKGHRGQLQQAVLNLINNSFDAVDSLSEKWIEITAVEGNENVEIFFKDSGDGIPVLIREKMLEPFFTTKKMKGTGLGLPLVKGIAQKHGGDLVYIDKAPHTTFMLELPKANFQSSLH